MKKELKRKILEIFKQIEGKGKDYDTKMDIIEQGFIEIEEIQNLNLDDKIDIMKKALLKLNLEKKGTATITAKTSYNYFELSTLEPPIIDLAFLLDINIQISTDNNEHTMTLTLKNKNNENEVKKTTIPFLLPTTTTPTNEDVSIANGKNMKNLGSNITYSRRYLYLITFNIIDNNDIEKLDDVSNKTPNNTNFYSYKVQPKQQQNNKNISNENVNNENTNNKGEMLNFEGYFIKKGGSFTTKTGENRTYCQFKNGANEKLITAILDDKKLSGLVEGNLYEITIKKYGDNNYCTKIEESVDVPF